LPVLTGSLLPTLIKGERPSAVAFATLDPVLAVGSLQLRHAGASPLRARLGPEWIRIGAGCYRTKTWQVQPDTPAAHGTPMALMQGMLLQQSELVAHCSP
jgi:hypothetical protein